MDIILKHTLLNAQQYGKANEKAVLGKVMSEDPSLKKDIKKLLKNISNTVRKVNGWSKEHQKKELKKFGKIKKPEKKQREGLPELKNAITGKVVMRVAPYPSGPLHIGHAKQFVINDWYVKKYKGKLILFMDDTIGSVKKQIIPEAYKLIPKGLDWLKVKYHKTYYKSDRLKIYYDYAKQMIEKDKAYVCECNQATLRKNRMNKVECLCRSQTTKINIDKWKKMLKGKYKEGEAVLRIKTNMQDPDPAFRDRVLCRISKRSHPKTKKKYKVWPLLDFSWAIDDHLIGVTHIIRGKELMMETKMEKCIWDIFGWKHPETIHSGTISIDGVKLSKSKAQHEVKSGKYSGWDDPRTWSLQSLKRRGFEPEAIRKFALSFGVTEHEAHVSIDKLYSINRKIIDKKAERYFAVFEPVELKLDKSPIKTAKAPLFPGKKKYRKIPVGKKIYIEKQDYLANKGKDTRLMHLFNIIVNKNAEYTSKILKDNKKIHWISNKKVKIKIVLENGQEVSAYAEPDIKKVKKNDIVQFERLFFARCDKKNKFYFLHR